MYSSPVSRDCHISLPPKGDDEKGGLFKRFPELLNRCSQLLETLSGSKWNLETLVFSFIEGCLFQSVQIESSLAKSHDFACQVKLHKTFGVVGLVSKLDNIINR